MNQAPKIIIIAGPNGAGKTTFASEFLPKEANCPAFINADLIAAGLSPFKPDLADLKAARIMLELVVDAVRNRQSFAIETTLSGLSYAVKIPQWRKLGFRVELFFLSLPSVEFAISRVAERVAQGGHNIPEAVIRRRYASGIHNFHNTYKSLVDEWCLFDNSQSPPLLLEWSQL